MKTWIFAGQGVQRNGMGAELFPLFPELVRDADRVLSYSLEELCMRGTDEQLSKTQFTQPVVYAVNAMAALRRLRDGERPEFLLGHSVSEYVALFVAGVFDFATGLRLVQKRGELMAQAMGGGMAAVIGLDAEQVAAVLERHGLTQISVANYNSPKQIVVSGVLAEVLSAEAHFLAAGATYYKVLPVSGAFHSRWMADAQSAFATFAAEIEFGEPTIPVISNVTARPHWPGRIRELMVEQITAPVKWAESIRYLLAKGLSSADFEEVAPEGVSVVKAMVVRTEREAGPLPTEVMAQEAEEIEAPIEASAETKQESQGAVASGGFRAGALGSQEFCERFGLKFAYVAGAMYQGISSVELVVSLADAGLMGFYGAGGIPLPKVEAAIREIQSRVKPGAPYGVNFLAHTNFPALEDGLTDILLRHNVRTIEASAFMEITPALVRYRAKGLSGNGAGSRIEVRNRIIAKVSRADVASQFAMPAPERIVARLLAAGAITTDEAEWLRHVPVADALCVEADSGGHTDQGMPFVLLPAILRVRDAYAAAYPRYGRMHVGAAGGIGTPEAAAAAFVMGADYILTGSVNQCTVEGGTSEAVKIMLQEMQTYDTDYAPSGEMFEMGSKVQVLKRGVFFPARANKLVALYRQFGSLDELDAKDRLQIQERYFKRSFETVFDEVRASYPEAEIERAERDPHHRMALVFKRYFKDTTRWALAGDLEHKIDFQVHCGPAMGAFNQWVAGTPLESWRNRRAPVLAEHLMSETASLLNLRFAQMR